MESNNNILASSVNNKNHITVFDKMMQQRFASLDIGVVLMYLVDIAHESALPALASQFDVLGYNGWFLTTNTQERRDLIKRAIELKKYRGTNWAIKESLKSIGFFDVQIQEGAGSYLYNGEQVHDGTINYGDGNWAKFRLSLLDLGEWRGFSVDDLASIQLMVGKYKPQRSVLTDIILKATTTDEIDITDDDLTGNFSITETLDKFNVSNYYDGSILYDGSELHSADTSEFEMAININNGEDIFSPANDDYFNLNIVYLAGSIFILSESGDQLLDESGIALLDESSETYYTGP
jgi:hypothetical protein